MFHNCEEGSVFKEFGQIRIQNGLPLDAVLGDHSESRDAAARSVSCDRQSQSCEETKQQNQHKRLQENNVTQGMRVLTGRGGWGSEFFQTPDVYQGTSSFECVCVCVVDGHRMTP